MKTYDQVLNLFHGNRQLAYKVSQKMGAVDTPPEFPLMSPEFNALADTVNAAVAYTIIDDTPLKNIINEMVEKADTFDECFATAKFAQYNLLPMDKFFSLLQKALAKTDIFVEIAVIHGSLRSADEKNPIVKEAWDKMVQLGSVDDWIAAFQLHLNSMDRELAELFVDQIASMLKNEDTPA
jgi:hypothetical protein